MKKWTAESVTYLLGNSRLYGSLLDPVNEHLEIIFNATLGQKESYAKVSLNIMCVKCL